eukprot:2338509-Karenia_brevis.AAC.1
MVQAIKWIIVLRAHCKLKAVLLENVKGVLMSFNGLQPFFCKLLDVLRSLVPEFEWGCDLLKACDYKLPQTRERALLRGLHKSFCAAGLPQ